MKEQITELNHPSMYAWFTKYSYNNSSESKYGLKNGKLNFEDRCGFKKELPYIKYPLGEVKGMCIISYSHNITLINSPTEVKEEFYCHSSDRLLSFKGFPKKIDGNINIDSDFFQIYTSKNNRRLSYYKIYLAMWLEMLDSVTENERWNYINEYKNKNNYNTKYSVIPKEILLEFGVL